MFKLLLCMLGFWPACTTDNMGDTDAGERTGGTEPKSQTRRAMPVGKLLSDDQLQAYQRHLNQHECAKAAGLLIKAIARNHPQLRQLGRDLEKIFDDQADPADQGVYRWFEKYISKAYPHLHFCRLENQLNSLDKRIDAGGQNAGLEPYFIIRKGKDKMEFDTQDRARDHVILGISILVEQDFAPAFSLKARLLRRRDLKGTRDPHFEYFLLRRACYSGHSCAENQAQLKEVAGLLSPQWVCILDQDARHPYKYYIENRKEGAWEACGRFNPPEPSESGR